MSCPFSHDDAAYVLGALSPGDHRRFEEHLPTCAECTEAVGRVAGLPGLLAKVPVADIEQSRADQGPDLPDATLTTLLTRVSRSRRRRRWRGAALVAAAACLAAVGAVAVIRPGSGSVPIPPQASATGTGSPIALPPVGESPFRATAVLTDEPWGTSIDLQCSYPVADGTEKETYTLVVTNHAGKSEQVAAWTTDPSGETQVTGSSSWSQQDIASIEIRAGNGTAVNQLAT